jgi:hypothetical protein
VGVEAPVQCDGDSKQAGSDDLHKRTVAIEAEASAREHTGEADQASARDIPSASGGHNSETGSATARSLARKDVQGASGRWNRSRALAELCQGLLSEARAESWEDLVWLKETKGVARDAMVAGDSGTAVPSAVSVLDMTIVEAEEQMKKLQQSAEEGTSARDTLFCDSVLGAMAVKTRVRNKLLAVAAGDVAAEALPLSCFSRGEGRVDRVQ